MSTVSKESSTVIRKLPTVSKKAAFQIIGAPSSEKKEEVKREKGVREGTGPEGERGGRMRKKSGRKTGPKACSKMSDWHPYDLWTL